MLDEYDNDGFDDDSWTVGGLVLSMIGLAIAAVIIAFGAAAAVVLAVVGVL